MVRVRVRARERDREEGGDGNQRALGSLEFLAQDADTSGKTLVDAWNGFNDLSRLAMMWNLRHCWLSGARFAFNCYRHWAQLLSRQLGGRQSQS